MCDCCDPHDGDRDLFVPDVLLEVLALTAARRPRERRDQVAAAAAVPGGLRGGVLYPTPRRLSRPDWGGLPCSGYPGLVRVPVCGDVSCRHLPCYTWHLGAHRPDTLYSRLMQRRGSAAPDQGDDGILRDLLQKPIILECGAEADDAHDGLVQPVQATVTTPGGTVTLYRWPSPDPTASQVAVGPAAAPAASLVDKAARRKADRKRSMTTTSPVPRGRGRAGGRRAGAPGPNKHTAESMRAALVRAITCVDHGEHKMSDKLKRALHGVSRALH
ncbi:uncharacterized protein LOC113204052 [Frankliniella occidentalis]|uniref:Uncharacterized protein LOC113204052 n=1 Tax=Frankliniella occidentalis TaxID=133901 RepID=A0A6J1S7Z1_FRAOC|nr:uncharacterized protein LOC113204052 [Frankliniella occidentalis]XP_052132666.1 uncharacterized protein LOC113204052 [Frankliniella occidentalis]